MSQPRNNLDELQRQLLPPQQQPYNAPTPSQKTSKFKPAKAGNGSTPSTRKPPGRLPSFATPGYGKQRSRPPATTPLHPHPSNDPIDISSPDSTSSGSIRAIPHKRLSSDFPLPSPTSPKRPRLVTADSEKENVFTTRHKGKEKEWTSPCLSQPHSPYTPGPSSQRLEPPLSVLPQPLWTPSHPVTVQSRGYTYGDHSDLRHETIDRLWKLYEINDRGLTQARKARDKGRMRRDPEQDAYMLEIVMQAYHDRVDAITSEIGARENGSETVLPSPRAALDPASDTTFTTYPPADDVDYEPESLSGIGETQVMDEYIGNDTPAILNISHGSTLVADDTNSTFVNGNLLGKDTPHVVSMHALPLPPPSLPPSSASIVDIVDTMDSVSVPPPPVPQPPPRRPFAAADEYDRRQGVQSGITSDSRANNATEDNSIEILPPDIDGSTSIFPSVARLRPRPVPIQPDNKLKASPHYPEVIRKLRDVFHLEHFRKNQLAAIISTLEGRDALVLMPTGGGKSLCYQLPAVCTGGKTTGVTVVISPLLALMEDQVECLRADNIDAMDFQEDGSFHAFRTAAKKPDLLYITPEKLSESDSIKNLFKGLHSRQQIARFVIDEAHLISTWGRGFRSHGYDAIRNLREEYPGIPIMALTATATSRVLQDIVGSLRLKDYVLLSQSFNRPNLRYTVVPKGKNNDISIVQFIQEKYPHDTGIIYCLSRDSTEFVARRLMQQGFKAKHYHAGMDKDDRKHIQKEWQRGEIKIMIATIAFGMGVNKADVRYVIHYDLPGSIDAYCQETGRAGRDGKHADCILYFNGGDVARRISMFKKDLELNEEERERSIQGVRDVGSFCLNDIDCRRVMILQHFEEPFSSASCHGTCDNCASVEPISELDLTASAIKFVNLVKELEDRTLKITSVQCIHAFRGTQPTDMERRGFHVLNGFATGKDISADLAKRMVDHLLDRQILINELEESQVQGRAPISYIYLGPNANKLLAARQPFLLKVRSSKKLGGASRSGRGPPPSQPAAPPVPITIRRKRPRGEIPDDPVEPFPSDDDEPPLAYIEPELNGRPETPPLVMARRLRASPSIEVVEESHVDSHQECYRELCELRNKLAQERSSDPEDILDSESLQTLSLMPPSDAVSFKEILTMSSSDVHATWLVCGQACLDITTRYAMRANGTPVVSNFFAPADLHARFDYQGAAGSKPLSRGR